MCQRQNNQPEGEEKKKEILGSKNNNKNLTAFIIQCYQVTLQSIPCHPRFPLKTSWPT